MLHIKSFAFILIMNTFVIISIAAAPSQIVIQGTLTDSGGAPLTGTRAWRVQYYDSESGGSALGSALTGSVAVSDTGRWALALTPPSAVEDASGEVWYELAIDSAATPDGTIDADDVFPNRMQVQSVLFARRAEIAENADKLGGVASGDYATDTEVNAAVAAKDALPTSATQYVMVQLSPGNTDQENGAALQSALTKARSLSPSATNCVAVIVPPGRYYMNGSPVAMDTPYMALVGLTTYRESQHIYGTASVNSGVIVQSTDNIRIENLKVECTNDSYTLNENHTDPAAYFPNVSWVDSNIIFTGVSSNTFIKNCAFLANDTNAWSMRIGGDSNRISYGGAYENCSGGKYAFGGRNFDIRNASFTNCTGGDYAFGGLYGYLYNSTFTNCTGGDYAFGGGSEAGAGTYQEGCTYTRCIGGDYSFGGRGSTVAGTFILCTGGNYAFAALRRTVNVGLYYYCIGGENAFSSSIIGSPYYCIQNGTPYTP